MYIYISAIEDFTHDSQIFTIPFSSQSPFMNISGLIVDDDVSEQLEFFTGEISLVSGNSSQVQLTNSRVRIEILSDDGKYEYIFGAFSVYCF